MRIRRSFTLALGALVGLATLFAGSLVPASAAQSVAVTAVNGMPVQPDGTLAKRVKGSVLDVTGTADTAPPLLADAGDSAFVEAGAPAEMVGAAAGGTSPYTFAWSFEGSADRFSAPDAFETAFATHGLSGPVALELRVTDSAGATAVDTARLFVYSVTAETVLDVTASVGAGASLVAAASVSPDIRHPFTIPAGSDITDLDVVLSWGLSYQTPAVNLAGFNLQLEDPTGTEVSAGQGAEFTEPEDVHIASPSPGAWTAIVQQILTLPDTYHLTATTKSRPFDPVPHIRTDGPFDFLPGAPQTLTAAVSGGTAPLSTKWDLDFDGIFETPDAPGGVTSFLPVGTHFVTAKTTDAAGYERRETTAVRVGVPSSTSTPGLVVVGVSDTGINLYHEDFRASTFPDERILQLTDNFTKHPSAYIPGYPANVRAKQLTFDEPFAAGANYPAADAALWTRAATPLGEMFWVPGTKVIGVIDAGDTQPINGDADTVPVLDEDGHGTASASVAVGNLYGYCPTCLLVFGESFAADAAMYERPWIDLASNSFGSAANVGFAGLLDPSFPKTSAERGQIALYAAGNGNANAFESPEQTYTSENLGADWIIRVGAADKESKKPIVGTGKPVDISSWGLGEVSGPHRLTAADNTSASGTTSHSGTSAATPYSTGVFGTVLGTVREALGDAAPGQKNASPGVGDGIIARGQPVEGSPYVGDGVLTRAELVEVMFKTAAHATGSTPIGFPVMTPPNPAQYVVEGYGIVEPESGERALSVLLDGEPLPERPDEDEFFAADSALRDALWGTWSGGGENSRDPGAGTASNFGGATLAGVATWDAAWALLQAEAGPFSSNVSNPPGVAISTPEDGTIVDPTTSPTIAVRGSVAFPDAGPLQTRLFPRRDDCGTENDNLRLTRADGGDAGTGCGYIPGVSAYRPVGEALGENDLFGFGTTEAFPLIGDDLPITLGAGTATGTLHYISEGPSPLAEIGVALTADDGTGARVLGSDVVAATITQPLGTTAFTFEIAVPADAVGVELSALSLEITQREAQGGMFLSLDDPASFIDVPEAGLLPPRFVDVSFDDPDFTRAAPAVVNEDGTWGATLDVATLLDGGHTVYARARQLDWTSPTASVGIEIRRPAGPPPVQAASVQLQLVRAGADLSATWIDAASTTGTSYATWAAQVAVESSGTYELVTRLLVRGSEVARTVVVIEAKAK